MTVPATLRRVRPLAPLTLLLAVLLVGCAAFAQEPEKPNILFILTDDQEPSTLGT
jgi:hypothetical protein